MAGQGGGGDFGRTVPRVCGLKGNLDPTRDVAIFVWWFRSAPRCKECLLT